MHSPLEQFLIKPLFGLHIGGYDLSFSNSALMMLIAITLVTMLMVLGTARRALVPGRVQSLAEVFYELVAGMLKENVGSEGRAFFPFVFTLFMFILLGNLLGMIPYSFTFTSHIIVTFALAMVVFVLVTIVGLVRHKLHFFGYFFPEGAPIWLAPIIVPIEVISYLSRPVSLSVRLFANMTAGHTMLKVFAGFCVMLGLVGVVPMFVNVALIGLEILIACLQAYVFAILTCLYLHDAIHLH